MVESDIIYRKENQRYIYLLNVIAAFAVVMLHTNGCFWEFSTDKYWSSANIIESIGFFAVPVFFMITGATLIDYQKRYTTREFFQKRIHKTVIPFVLWSILGLLYKVLLTHEISLETLSVRFLIDGIINTKIIDIYWFFIPLFCVYLCIPLLASISEEKKKKTFQYLIVICLMINHIIPFIKAIWNVQTEWPFRVYVGMGNIIFLIIGYYINNYEIPGYCRKIIYILAAFGLLAQIWGTYYLSMHAGMIITTYKGYENLPSLLYASGIFLFFKYHGDKIWKNNTWVWNVIKNLSRYTFAIYLLHYYVIDIMKRVFVIDERSIVFRLGAPFIVIPICVVIAKLLRKIPVVRNIIP